MFIEQLYCCYKPQTKKNNKINFKILEIYKIKPEIVIPKSIFITICLDMCFHKGNNYNNVDNYDKKIDCFTV